MNASELSELPPLLDVPSAAKVLGIGRSLAYELLRSGRWPTPVIRMGRLIKIPTMPLLRLLDPELPLATLAAGRLPEDLAPDVGPVGACSETGSQRVAEGGSQSPDRWVTMAWEGR